MAEGLFIVAASYILFVSFIYVFWKYKTKLNRKAEISANDWPSVSIVCVGRNEESNLPYLLASIKSQKYPGELEFIYVDDHSADSTYSFFENVDNGFPIHFVKANEGCAGKKAGQALGIRMAKGEWILCTDADCEMGEKWAMRMISSATTTDKKWIGGVVAPSSKTHLSFLGNWQVVETLYLNLIGGVCICLGLPILANGANMCFEKNAYPDFIQKSKNPSGDDIELIQHCASENGTKKVGFEFSDDSKVITDSPTDIIGFFNQKVRWASKFTMYNRWDIKLFSLYFALIQLSWLLLAFFRLDWFWGLTFVKCLLEVFVFFDMSKHYKVKQNLLFSLITNTVYPIYSILIGLLARFYPYEWKERKIKV